ncbi:MAG: hypothetical protein R3207_06260 [Oceanospirillum sp.]|nr:hypothetical protein [Oceanospirillum sp.]
MTRYLLFIRKTFFRSDLFCGKAGLTARYNKAVDKACIGWDFNGSILLFPLNALLRKGHNAWLEGVQKPETLDIKTPQAVVFHVFLVTQETSWQGIKQSPTVMTKKGSYAQVSGKQLWIIVGQLNRSQAQSPLETTVYFLTRQ